MSDSLTFLVLADLHYVRRAQLAKSNPSRERMYPMGLEWTWRAVREARRLTQLDAIVLLGDLMEEGNAPGAEHDLAELAAQVRDAGAPVIVVPGNHDGDAQRVLRAFEDTPGAHRIKGCTLYSFADPYAADDTMARPRETIEAFLRETADGPVVALQHIPIYPDVEESDYPYMPLNAAEIMESYQRKGVVLSISGHYHLGQEPIVKDGVTYFTAAALARTPYSFAIVRIEGGRCRIETHTLRAEETGRFDTHVHTHFGYCAVDVHPAGAMERIDLLGLDGVACVEHAGQIYLSREEYWQRVHVENPSVLRQAREKGTDRMAAYRVAMSAFRSPRLRVGLEVEVDADGRLNLLEEDREGWDILLGAVHWTPDRLPSRTPMECARAFMTVTEQLVTQGVNVLAHPFRYFHSKKLPPPVELYPPVVRLLKAHGVAAEINFHINEPHAPFFRLCQEEGVRVVTGSDAHVLRDIGDLHQHWRMLDSIRAQ